MLWRWSKVKLLQVSELAAEFVRHRAFAPITPYQHQHLLS